MLMMAFLIAFCYNILRGMKDSLIVTAADSGAAVIPFLKVWAMLPMAVIMTTLYVKLSHRYSSEKVFYIMVSIFLSFFAIFTFILYPLQDYIHPHAFCIRLQEVLPEGLGGMVAMIRYWSFSLFYGMCEIWGVICLTVGFWGFVNEVTKVSEATRFYGLFGLGANTSTIAAGPVAIFLSNRAYNPNWIIGADAWHQSLILLTLAVLAAGISVMLLFRWFHKRVIPKVELPETSENKQLKKLERKPSMRESFRYLANSRYLIMMAIVVVAYNLVINLVEVAWKDQVKILHPEANSYNAYMGTVTMWTGIFATLMAIFVSGNVIRKWGWTVAALLTPAVLIITSFGFFGFLLTGVASTSLIVFFGSAQNVLSRASKYTVFDATKELCFIPLGRESKVKGKAAIDGVSSRVGKSGGAVIYQFLLIGCGQVIRCAPYVALILTGVLGGWVFAVRSLGRKFNRLTGQEPEPVEAPLKEAI